MEIGTGLSERSQQAPRSQPHAPRAARTCDLVLLTWNRADLLMPCVESILRYTDIPSRLLIVDNASTDADAIAFLERVQGTPAVEVEVVRRSHNDGYAVGMNEGLRRATAPWVCLLNNDILVTEGWLSEMLHVAQANPAIGLLNPMSNEFGVRPAQADETIDGIARSRRRYHGQWLESFMGVGFCLLFVRSLVEQIGYLDEEFKFLYHEDRDYSVRVRQAGYLCAIAEGAYVYHHGRSGMKQNPALEGLLYENEERFYQKWQHLERSRRIACVVTHRCLARPQTTRDRIRNLANAGHVVWVYVARQDPACLPHHIDVRFKRLRGPAYPLQVVVRVLTKKKRFHRILVYDRWLGSILRLLRPLHRADVVIEDT